MTALPKTDEYISEEEYFALLEKSEINLDWIDGRVYPRHNPYGLLPEAMAGASDAHIDIAAEFFTELNIALRGKPCSVVSENQKVKADHSYVYPDITIYCGEREKDERGNLTNPVVIIEVLSPGTQVYDKNAKWEKMREIETLRDYLLVSQERVLVEHRHKRDANHWDLTYLNRLDDEIVLDSIQVRLRVAAVYARVRFDAENTESTPE